MLQNLKTNLSQCPTEPVDAEPGPPPPVCDGEKMIFFQNIRSCNNIIGLYPLQTPFYHFVFQGDKQACANGVGCFEERQKCDFFPDCGDATDEKGCPTDFFFDQCTQVSIFVFVFVFLSIFVFVLSNRLLL